MNVPLKYNLRHLRVRWKATLITVISMALVVMVFVMIMSLARGLRGTFSGTGDNGNLLVIRKGALAESSSQIAVEDVKYMRYLDGIASASAEVIVLITLPRSSGGNAHVQVRGLETTGIALRSQVKLVEGRMFDRGRRECIVSRKVAKRFKGTALGEQFRSGKDVWRVVGIFEARKTAYESEIWADADEVREGFRRSFYCSMTIRPANTNASAALIERIESERGRQLRAMAEAEYYRAQTKTAGPIQALGACLAAVMSIGAIFSAMNTMYATVGARTREIGTLRVLGFAPGSIYFSFLLESLILALVAGVLGCLLALPMNGLITGTFNWSSFAEVAFEFHVTGELLVAGILFAVVMGALGGMLPARSAARKPLLDALRAT
ncbi:MAG TPA: ABC transporter permease [Verrucomicrobiae bacterium]|nr:ABC transporter permease [Verrucomicrobiae bacterium]